MRATSTASTWMNIDLPAWVSPTKSTFWRVFQ